jgi:mRNA degradation ribonuclease J1/J2
MILKNSSNQDVSLIKAESNISTSVELHTMMMVDGVSISDTQDVVIRDRVMLAQDGMFVIIALVDQKTGKLKKISRSYLTRIRLSKRKPRTFAPSQNHDQKRSRRCYC